MSCHFVAKDEPRVLKGRHHDECPELVWRVPLVWIDCAGCQPCPRPHCRDCGHRHADVTCPECVGSARDALDAIGTMTLALPFEAETKGVESEAAMLEGPVANPEQWRQRGRYGHTYQPDSRLGENHPLWVLGTWDMLITEHLGHSRRRARITVMSAASYLKANLTDLANDPEFPFEDLAKDVRRCETHLEQVLHEGEQHDTGAPCMSCGSLLERTWGKDGKGDGWICPRCRQTSTEDQYRFAVAHLHREEAKHLTDRDMEIRTGVKAGTVRVWARNGMVGKTLDSGRVLYCVADVERHAQAKGLVS